MDILRNLNHRELKVIGQSHEKHIIFCYSTEHRRIVAFDQHAVHERIRYEQLLNQLFDEKGQIVTYQLQKPLKFALNQQMNDELNECAKSSSIEEVFAKIKQDTGITFSKVAFCDENKYKQINCNGKKTIALDEKQTTTSINTKVQITALPVIIKIEDFKKYSFRLYRLINNFNLTYQNGKSEARTRLIDYAKSKACHGAIRFGTQLSIKQCEYLIKKLLKCREPFRCAHARCSVAIMPNLDIKLYRLEGN